MSAVVQSNPIAGLKEIGKHMPRDRHQRGWVELTGKRTKKWKGHYYVYVRQADGSERRKHRSVILGVKSQMKKWEAEQELCKVIARETAGGVARPDNSASFEWFWLNRYQPVRGSSLKPSSRYQLSWLMEKHILPRLGERPLGEIHRAELQTFLVELADQGYSYSLIHKVRTYLKAVMDEAVEQEFLSRNPARKLVKPPTRPQAERFLSENEIHRLLGELHGRNLLMVRILVLCGLRPGELFALRWNDWEPGILRVDESVWEGDVGSTKNEASNSKVTLPDSLERELAWWREHACPSDPSAFMFPSRRGTPINSKNWLHRSLQPAGERAGVSPVNFQVLRRTFATLVQQCGTLKDAQAQLRHATPTVTLGVYMKAIPDSVKAAVEALDRRLTPPDLGLAGTTVQ